MCFNNILIQKILILTLLLIEWTSQQLTIKKVQVTDDYPLSAQGCQVVPCAWYRDYIPWAQGATLTSFLGVV